MSAPLSVSLPLPAAPRITVTLPVAVPSDTVIVSVALPVRPDAAVADSVRLAPAPPKPRLASGTRVRLLEAPVRIRLAAGLSTPVELCCVGGRRGPNS